MSDDNTSDMLSRKVLAESGSVNPELQKTLEEHLSNRLAEGGLPSPEAQKRSEERRKREPIAQLRISIFDADAGRPTEIQWQVSPWSVPDPANLTPDTETKLLDRVAQEIQGIRQRLEVEGFPNQLLDRVERELQRVPERLQKMGFPGRGRLLYRCSFCGKNQEQVHRLIAGPGGVYICDECINLCREIIEEEQRLAAAPSPGESGAGSEG